MSTQSTASPDRKLIRDLAAQAAVVARQERLDRAQVSKILELFEARSGISAFDAVQILKMFILRQVQRGEIRSGTARLLVEALSKICTESRCDVDTVREFLVYFRWLYEALEICRGNLPRGDPRNITFDLVISHITTNCLRY